MDFVGLPQVIIAILGFIWKLYQDNKADKQRHIDELKTNLAEDNVPNVVGNIDDQHQRVLDTLYASGWSRTDMPTEVSGRNDVQGQRTTSKPT